MFRSFLVALSLFAMTQTASAQFYSYGGYHNSYSYSQPQQNYGNRGFGGYSGYGGGYGHQFQQQHTYQYLVPVTYRVPVFIQRPVVRQAPVIQHVQPTCAPQCQCGNCQ